jgi:hypothetical protein
MFGCLAVIYANRAGADRRRPGIDFEVNNDRCH